MINKTDDELMAAAQELFKGFDVTVGECSDESAAESYRQNVSALMRRGYTPVISVSFVRSSVK